MLKLVKFLWSKKLDITKAFITAVVFSVGFLIFCSTLVISTDNLSYETKAAIGAINIWRIVVVCGLLTLGLSIFSIIKKKMIGTVIFLWMFWILGTSLTVLLSYGAESPKMADLFKITSLETKDTISFLWLIMFIVWVSGIYYCRRFAIRLGSNTYIATLLGIFLPVISVLIYSYRSKEKEGRVRLLKISASIIIVLLAVSAGAAYYTLGTPEYSLYKLKKAIMVQDTVEFEKYFDISAVSEKFNESPSTLQEEFITALNTSFWEIKVENPDKGKNAVAYISTGLTGSLLDRASVTYFQENPYISLNFNSKGKELYLDLIKNNLGKRITLFLGGQLVSTMVMQTETGVSEAVFQLNYSTDQIIAFVKRINEEKDGMISGLDIKGKTINKETARVEVGIIGSSGKGGGIILNMVKTPTRQWKVVQMDLVTAENNRELPALEGEKNVTFEWKYKGKKYSLDEKLYDSLYRFYNNLPAESIFNGESLIQELEKDNELFILNKDGGDGTISELAQSIKSIGEENNLNANQVIELVASFVQTIPYDTNKFDEIKAGARTKVYYSYEVLFNNKGVCSDKSYLAYSLLRALGYGASFFLFPEDQHIAVGVECPREYSNYDSGYCFLETTSLGNKIGSTPSIIKESGVAASEIVLSDYGTDATEDESSPLGKIEVLNKTTGLVYTGIIDTVNTQKEIDSLLSTIRRMDRELDASERDLNNRDKEISRMVDKLDKLEKNLTQSNYDDYSDYFSKYKKAYNSFEKDRKAFNAKIATRNQINNKYNSLVKSFYQ